nr:putative zinc finger, U1-type [Tanacetum cinerariifolium]
MNRGFLDSGGRKNNHTKKTNTDIGSGSITELDGILNDATPLVDASVAKEAGKSDDLTASGVKLKQSTPPLSAAASSSGFSLDSSKKRIEEWNCAICDVSATPARGFCDHIAGKKHQPKVATMKAGNSTCVNIGLVGNKNSVVEQPLEITNLSQRVSVDSKNDKIVGESENGSNGFANVY